MKIPAIALALLFPSLASCGTLAYDLYEFTPKGRVLIESKVIDTKALVTTAELKSAKGDVTRRVSLGNGYSIGCNDYGERSPSGFGCWLRRNRSLVSNDQYEGFSWEWYDQSMGSLYAKRQGTGRASLQVVPLGGKYAFQRIKFLDDTSFRLKVKPSGGLDDRTHEIVIKAGSELALLPEANQ